MKIGISSAIVMSGGLALFLAATTIKAQTTTPVASPPSKAQTAVRMPVAPDALSEATMRVIKLYKSGASRQELLSYTTITPAKFNLSVADVNYLKDLGLSTDVVFAMIRNEGARQHTIASTGERQTVQSWANTAPADEPQAPAAAAKTPKAGEPIVEAAGSSAPVANSEDTTAPKYYDSTDNTDAVPAQPPAYQYGAPQPGYGNGYDNRFVPYGDPRYNQYNGYQPGNPVNPYYQRFDNPRRYAP